VELNSLSVATELKLFSLVALTLIMLSGVYPLQFRGVYGDNDVGTGSGKPIPNLCTYLYCCPSFSKIINLSNDTIFQDEFHASAAGSNIYILWKESAIQYGSGSLFLVKSTDYGHTFDSKKEIAGETKESNIASYANYVYVVFASSRGVFLIKSTDWGNSFGSPVKLNQLNDVNSASYLPDVKIGASVNNVYIVWTEFTGQYKDVFFIRSTDGGNSFSSKKNLSANIGQSVEAELETAGNNVFVVWTDYTNVNGTPEVLFKRSVDGGSSFGKVINVSNSPGASGEPQVGASGNNVYVIWDDTDPNSLTVILKKSSDDGHTFGNNKVITSNGMLPLVDVSSDNKVYLLWMQQALRNPNDVNYIFERSINEGTSFSCLTKLKSSGLAMDTQLISTDARTFIIWRDYVKMTSDVLFTATPP